MSVEPERKYQTAAPATPSKIFWLRPSKIAWAPAANGALLFRKKSCSSYWEQPMSPLSVVFAIPSLVIWRKYYSIL